MEKPRYLMAGGPGAVGDVRSVVLEKRFASRHPVILD